MTSERQQPTTANDDDDDAALPDKTPHRRCLPSPLLVATCRSVAVADATPPPSSGGGMGGEMARGWLVAIARGGNGRRDGARTVGHSSRGKEDGRGDGAQMVGRWSGVGAGGRGDGMRMLGRRE